jgi:polyhydroxyalkanoate synthesis regulator protein
VQRHFRELSRLEVMAKSEAPLVIKKYANRRLYDTATSP